MLALASNPGSVMNSGSHAGGGGLSGCSLPPILPKTEIKKKNRFCGYYDIKIFT
jgi:hypothetical protein